MFQVAKLLLVFEFICLLQLYEVKGKVQRRTPIILIPGTGGNQLETRVDSGVAQCTNGRVWHRLWLDVWQLGSSRIKCWADTIKLMYNTSTHSYTNMPGVYTRVPGWGSTSSVEYIDPSWSAWVLRDAGNYMNSLVDFLVSLGYEKGRDLRAAPYDFRYSPRGQTAYFRRLKLLIEETSMSLGGAPVMLVTHSMGGLLTLSFLQQQKEKWKTRYIREFIPIATPWTGVVVNMLLYASGYNMDIGSVNPRDIREEQRSHESNVFLVPHPQHWHNKSQVLVTTPHKKYTVTDYDEFFNDIGYPQGIDMLDDVLNLIQLVHPGVSTTCVYSLGVGTPQHLLYGEGFPDSQPIKSLGDGDGTVGADSLAACARFLDMQKDTVKIFEEIKHGEILKSSQIFQFLKEKLTS